MDSARFQTVKQLFERVSDSAPAERARLLDQACGDDRELRREVEELLAHSLAAEAHFLEAQPVAAQPAEQTRLSIDGFRILARLGVGASGIVYRAEQLEPRREVALKVLRIDSLAPGQVARFRREAEILAGLRHAGIAQVFGVGVAADGELALPWIAMELVHGVPIDQHVAAARPSPRELLSLFREVCAALEHAHQRGIVHRDLKPSNVLVDERGHARVIDFGVARALADARESLGLPTRTGVLIGTLAYMSPEQARGEHERLSPASDVYALGVLLFELLSARLPIEVEQFDLVRAVQAIESAEPERLRRLRPDAPRDLDTIVGKALEKDPARRYASAGALALDLENLLAERPVAARRPTVAYQASKFVRRNRALSTGTLCVVVALSIGLGLALVNLRVARVQREMTSETLDFFAARFVSLAPQIGFGEAQRDDLEAVAARIRSQIEVDPERRGLHAGLAQVLHEIGFLDQARDDHAGLLERATEAHAIRARLVEQDPHDLTSWTHLSVLCAKLGEAERDLGRLAGRDAWFARALEIDERLVREHPDDLEFVEDLGWSLARVANCKLESDELADAECLALRRLADAERLAALDPHSWKYTFNLSHAHCFLASLLGRLERALPAAAHADECLRMARRTHEFEPERRDFLAWLANACRVTASHRALVGRDSESDELFAEALIRVEQVCLADPRRRHHIETLSAVVDESSRLCPVERRTAWRARAVATLLRVAERVASTGDEALTLRLRLRAEQLEREH